MQCNQIFTSNIRKTTSTKLTWSAEPSFIINKFLGSIEINPLRCVDVLVEFILHKSGVQAFPINLGWLHLPERERRATGTMVEEKRRRERERGGELERL